MSLSSHDFKAIYINRKSQETTNALADHKARLKDHNDIQSQVDAFLKSGGHIDVIETGHGSGKANLSPLTQAKVNPVLVNAIQNLRASFGKDLDIHQDMESGKYKAIYKGAQIGGMKTSLSKAETAIRCKAIKSRNNLNLKTAQSKSET